MEQLNELEQQEFQSLVDRKQMNDFMRVSGFELIVEKKNNTNKKLPNV